MTGTLFETIKSHVNILDAAARFGINVDRHGKALCFAHSEKTASLSFKGNRYKCFGCGANGDVIDMVSSLQGITTLEAAKQLDAMYSLHLFDKQADTADVRHRAQKARMERERLKAFEQWEQWACDVVAEYLRLMDAWKRDLAPRVADDISPLFVEACHRLGYYDYLYTEIFVSGDFAAKAGFYKTHAKEVEAVAKRIDRIRQNGVA